MMDYLRIAPDIDTDPDLEAAGWAAARVYELLLKVSGLKDLRGRIPPEYQKPSWLARRWNLTADDLPGVNPEDFIAGGISRLLQVGKLRADGSALIITGWDGFYAKRDLSTPRVQKHRETARNTCVGVKRSETAETDETEETDTPPTPPTPPTPLHSTGQEPPPPAGRSAVAADLLWRGFQMVRLESGEEAERAPSRAFVAWAGSEEVRSEAPQALLNAYARFLDDRGIRAKHHPTDVFIQPGVWGSRVTPADRTTGPPCECCGGEFFRELRGHPVCFADFVGIKDAASDESTEAVAAWIQKRREAA